MDRIRLLRAAIFLAASASLPSALGCAARNPGVETAPGLVALDTRDTQYAYRALAPEGVVLAVRAIDTGGRGDLDFWSRATSIRMQQMSGYALLGAGDVRSRDGAAGRELRFGHDEDGKPYLYTVRLFVSGERLFVVEAGGPRAQVERYGPSLAWMMESVKVR